ncbi:MAG: pyrroline-5-carboxylate reductase [Acidimicrobiales bacterium]|nr:MAG: pyrroline-5-carboxylate reductase [Acidimicrobiales bacterium]
MTLRLLVVGGGKMGGALVGGLLARQWAQPSEIGVVEPVIQRRRELGDRHPGLMVTGEVQAARGAVLAVKSADVKEACAALAGARVPRVVSIAAGVPLARLEEALGDDVAVVRAMPNTPALVGCGAAAIAAGSTATDDDLAWADSILAAVGLVVRVDEPLLDAVTGLSGSGPAYVFLVVEALIEAGVLNGLPREVSRALATQTVLGSARLLAESGQGAEELRAAVTSPGGTTAAGLRALEASAVRSALLEAVSAATERSRQLGRSG